mgnify:CR=1 FL=1
MNAARLINSADIQNADLSTFVSFTTMDFRITWQTSLGRFGWTDIVEATDAGDAVEAFQAARRDDSNPVPFDATIDQIKPA